MRLRIFRLALPLLMGLMSIGASATTCDRDLIYIFSCQANACLEEGLIYGNDFIEGYGCVSDYKVNNLDRITPEKLLKIELFFNRLGLTHPEQGFYIFRGTENKWWLEKLDNPESLLFKEFAEVYAKNLNSSISHKLKRMKTIVKHWWDQLTN